MYTYGDLIFREQYNSKNISRYIKRNFIYLILRKKEGKGGFSMKKIIFVDEDVDRFLYSFSSGLLLLVFLI